MTQIQFNNKDVKNPFVRFLVGFLGIIIALAVVIFIALPIVGVALSFAFGIVVVVLAALVLAIPLLLIILLPIKNKFKNLDFNIDIDEEQMNTSTSNFQDFELTNIMKIKLFCRNGNVSITGKEVDNLSVSLQETSATFKYLIENETLTIAFIQKEKVNVNIDTPKHIEMNLTNGAGNLDYKNLNGFIDTKVGAGNITGSALGASTKVKVGAGNISLTFNENLDKADIDIKMGTGNSTIFLPKESSVSANLKTAAGKLNSAFPNVENATFKVDMKAGAGSLDIQSL